MSYTKISFALIAILSILSCDHKPSTVQPDPVPDPEPQSSNGNFSEYAGNYVGSIHILQYSTTLFYDTTYIDTVEISTLTGDSFIVYMNYPNTPFPLKFVYNDSDYYESGSNPTKYKQEVWIYPENDSINVQTFKSSTTGPSKSVTFRGKKP